MNKTALVITSIADSSSPALRLYAKECMARNISFFVIGDTRSPKKFTLDGCDFWGLKKQSSLNFRLAQLLPLSHYARKNIGYLLAIQNGAQKIIETDDDNHPKNEFWDTINQSRQIEAKQISGVGWINIYQFFSDEEIWPRGFPLEKIKQKKFDIKNIKPQYITCPIQQGLADENPDVDAIYRLTARLPQTFKTGNQIALGNNAWSPFNSQNTIWFKEVMPLMYLPSFCSFRMTDIWRSLVAQRILWANDWSILFSSPTVSQNRNTHDLLKDFEDEIPGYLNNCTIATELAKIDLKKGPDALCNNLIKCYEMLIQNGWLKEKEAQLVNAWVEDISSIL